MRPAAFLFAGISLFAVPCLAADDIQIISVDGEPAAVGSWSGFYVGATGGYGWLRDEDFNFVPPLVSKGDDWIFGAHAGYMHAFGPMLIGLEGAYSVLDITFDGLPFTVTVEDAATVRVRAGFAVHDFLVSVHGGATYATTNIGLDDWGYNLGTAVEYMFSPNLIGGLQYDHHNFTNFDNAAIDAQLNTLTLRIGYKF